jgi:hypothetical protein
MKYLKIIILILTLHNNFVCQTNQYNDSDLEKTIAIHGLERSQISKGKLADIPKTIVTGILLMVCIVYAGSCMQ